MPTGIRRLKCSQGSAPKLAFCRATSALEEGTLSAIYSPRGKGFPVSWWPGIGTYRSRGGPPYLWAGLGIGKVSPEEKIFLGQRISTL